MGGAEFQLLLTAAEFWPLQFGEKKAHTWAGRVLRTHSPWPLRVANVFIALVTPSPEVRHIKDGYYFHKSH